MVDGLELGMKAHTLHFFSLTKKKKKTNKQIPQPTKQLPAMRYRDEF